MIRELVKTYKKQEDRICLSKITDKIEFVDIRKNIEITDFLDMYQISLVENFLRKIKYNNYILYGGYENAERKILIIYNEIYNKDEIGLKYSEFFSIVRVKLQDFDKGKYTHRNYLGGVVKVGLEREKVGDIIVRDDGADIITLNSFSKILINEITTLKRFENAIIKSEDIKDLIKKEVIKEEIKIIVPSLRLDNIVSDLIRTSRSKAVNVINQERVFINGQCETKQSKTIKIGDIITVRGKGRFVIKQENGKTRSGRPVLVIEKFV